MSKLKTAKLKTVALLFSSLLSPAAIAIPAPEAFNEQKMPSPRSTPSFSEFSTLIFTNPARTDLTLPYPATPSKADVSEARPSKAKPPQLKVWLWKRNTSSSEQLGQGQD